MDKYRLIFAVTTHAAGAMRDFFFYVIVVFYVYSIVGIGWFGAPINNESQINQIGSQNLQLLRVPACLPACLAACPPVCPLSFSL